MGLVSYEFRADHQHEIKQFKKVAENLYKYFCNRNETAVLIGNVNIGGVNLDGLLIKSDAIVILEFKDYEGSLFARINGDWECDGKIIKGGAGDKTVYEQASKNVRDLKRTIAIEEYFSQIQRHDIKCLVVLSKLKSFQSDFDRTANGWLSVTDVSHVASAVEQIKSKRFKDIKNNRECDVFFSQDDIIDFLRKIKIDERSLITDFSDTKLLPDDLFNEKNPHNGNCRSVGDELVDAKNENKQLQEENEKLKKELEGSKTTSDILKKIEELGNVYATNNGKIPTSSIESIGEKRKNEVGDGFIPSGLSNTQSFKIVRKRIIKPKVVNSIDLKTYFGKESMDDDQLDIIEKSIDSSLLVSGCAGSGKSVLAIYKAQQLVEKGFSVILIALTKSLTHFMKSDFPNIDNQLFDFFYFWQWENLDKPKADYIIVDEIQDFSKKEILSFMASAKKHFLFFGDSAQSIYNFAHTQPLSMDEISQVCGISPLRLYNNYRLPANIARIAQNYVGIDVDPFDPALYKNKDPVLPYFLHYEDFEDQVNAIISISEKVKEGSLGILVPTNDDVKFLGKKLREKDFTYEIKYGNGFTEEQDYRLDFHTKIPKIMTYHSAKGLQFKSVILPFFQGTTSEETQKSFYVAMTRTYKNLFLLYSSEKLGHPLGDVEPRFYRNSL